MTKLETLGIELTDAMIDAKKALTFMAFNNVSDMSSDDIKAMANVIKIIDMSLDYFSEANQVIAKIEKIDDNMSKILGILETK